MLIWPYSKAWNPELPGAPPLDPAKGPKAAPGCTPDRYLKPRTTKLLGASPLDPTPVSDLHASVTRYQKVSKYAHMTLIKCLKTLSFMGLRPLTPAGALPLDSTPIYAPLTLLYLIANTLAPPPHSHFEKRSACLHVTCKSGDDADFFLPPPKKKVFAHYVTPPSFLAFRPPPPPGHEKKSPPLFNIIIIPLSLLTNNSFK